MEQKESTSVTRKADSETVMQTTSEWKGEKEEMGKKRDACAIIDSISFTHAISMPKDTRDSCNSLNELVLMILRLADEEMLTKSGNPVFLKMKRELELYR